MERVRDAMIVAGGAGTRLWPLTATRPKPLVGFCGAPFLEGVLRRLATVGIDRVLLVVGADPAPFEILRSVADELGLELEAVAEPEPLDTAGGVRSALSRVRGPFLVLNGDILTDVDLAAVVAAHEAAAADASIVLTRVADTSSYGVCVREGTRIVDFVEKPPPGSLPGQDTVNAGTYVLEPGALARFPTGRLSFERDVFPGLVAAGAHVEGVVSDAAWADLGTPERYLDGHRAALDGELVWPSLEGIEDRGGGVWCAADVELAADVALAGPVLLGAGVVVGRAARVGPHVVLGAGSQVGANARIRDSVLGRDNVVGARAVLSRVVTGERTQLGAQVTASSGAVLGDDVLVAAAVRLEPDARIAAEA